MNSNHLDEVLSAMGRRHVLKAEDFESFRSEVWREIHHRKILGAGDCCASREQSWGSKFWGLFPKLIPSTLLLAVGIAWLTEEIVEKKFGAMEADRTARMLDLTVFSASAQGWADGQLIVKR